MNKAASKYLREVRKGIHCSPSIKKKFLRQLEDDVYLYCEDHANTDLQSLAKRFGSPNDIAADILSSQSVFPISRTQQIMQRFFYAVISAALIAVFIFACAEIYANYKQTEALDGFYVESITYESDVNSYVTQPTYAVEYTYHANTTK